MRLYDDHDALQSLRGYQNRLWTTPKLRTLEKATEIKPDAVLAHVNRVKNSHRGIKEFTGLEELAAGSVNQDFMDEICNLTNLKVLSLGYPTTVKDLSGLERLQNLHTLKIDSPRNITDFSVLTRLPKLHTLFIENAKHLTDVEFLKDADRLRVVGIEGDMWTHQKIASLKPFSGLKSLEALFLTTVQLADKDLTYLAKCRELKLLFCARFAPKKSFEALRKAMPSLTCSWCDKYEIDTE